MRHITRLSIAAAAAAMAAPLAAQAADLRTPIYKAPPPIYTWTGLYVGLNTGGSIGVSSTTDTEVLVGPPAGVGTNVMFNESFRHNPTGWIFGGQVGYNYQLSSWVFGVEADWQRTSQKDSASVGSCASNPTPGFFAVGGGSFSQCLTDEQKLTSFGTVRARGGFVVNDSLWYVTGGAAWATVKDSYVSSSSCNPVLFSAALCAVGPFLPGAAAFSHAKSGWTLGGGVETRLFGGWTAKLEYLYVDLGTVTDAFGVAVNPAFFGTAIAAASTMTVASSSRVKDNIVRLGLNYRFGAAVAPIGK